MPLEVQNGSTLVGLLGQIKKSVTGYFSSREVENVGWWVHGGHNGHKMTQFVFEKGHKQIERYQNQE